MLEPQLLADEGILVLTPQGPLEKADFERLALLVDPYIEQKGALKGVMIYAKSFPGWADFAALLTHLRFVKDHQQHVARVAAVSDSSVLTVLSAIAKHFVRAEVRHFEFDARDQAMRWLNGGD